MEISKSISEFVSRMSSDHELFPYLANLRGTFRPGEDTVYYSGPFWDQNEVEAAIESLLAGKWLSSGESVNKFERAFSKKFNSAFSVMTNSGSSANLVLIAALKEYFNWSDESEILVSVVGFPTTSSSVLQNQLVPVFVDVDWSDLNWDYSGLQSALTEKTKAVFFSPVLGNPGEFQLLLDFCKTNNLELILDNCDSLGSSWEGKFLNEYAVASSCSFYPAHHITTMEGGMVSSNIEEIITIARSFAWWGRSCYCVGRQNLLPCGTCKKRFDNWIPDCDFTVDHKYVFDRIGYNLKPLDLQGAIGLKQLEKFDEIHTKRKLRKSQITEILGLIDGLSGVDSNAKADVSWFGTPFIAKDVEFKTKVVAFLEENRIQTRNYFAGNLLMQPGFRHLGDWREFPVASEVLGRVFFVGASPTITDPMIDYIAQVKDKFLHDSG
jgi:CDP-6-deoxy-D-xylo-4-hexulose-3-dehydrase